MSICCIWNVFKGSCTCTDWTVPMLLIRRTALQCVVDCNFHLSGISIYSYLNFPVRIVYSEWDKNDSKSSTIGRDNVWWLSSYTRGSTCEWSVNRAESSRGSVKLSCENYLLLFTALKLWGQAHFSLCGSLTHTNTKPFIFYAHLRCNSPKRNT